VAGVLFGFFGPEDAEQVIPGARGLATRVGDVIWDRMIEQVMAGAQADFRPPSRLAKRPSEETKA